MLHLWKGYATVRILIFLKDVILEMQIRDRGLWLSSFKDVPMYRRGAVFPSMFPSGKNYRDVVDRNDNVEMGDDNDKSMCGNCEDGNQTAENPVTDMLTEEVSDLPLERCMRIVPHDQNTGAFFIAVLQKVSPLPGNYKHDISWPLSHNICK